MFLFAVRVALAALMLGVAGCDTPPWTVSSSPDAITLRWYSDETDIAAAQAIADRHCRSTGRASMLASSEQNGSIEIAEFRCR